MLSKMRLNNLVLYTVLLGAVSAHELYSRHDDREIVVLDRAGNTEVIIDEFNNDVSARRANSASVQCAVNELESEIDTSIKQRQGGECGMGRGCEDGLSCNSRFICE